MGSRRVVTPDDVLQTLMSDGTIDAIRLKIINQLKANEELKNNTITMVEQSKVLNTPSAEKQTKRELFDSLRRELETPVLEKASRAVWELILDSNNLGKEISDTVERVFCRLSGYDLPPQTLSLPSQTLSLPSTSAVPKPENEKNHKEKEDGDKMKSAEMLITAPPKKRSYSEMNIPASEVAINGISEQPSVSSDDVTVISTETKMS